MTTPAAVSATAVPGAMLSGSVAFGFDSRVMVVGVFVEAREFFGQSKSSPARRWRWWRCVPWG